MANEDVLIGVYEGLARLAGEGALPPWPQYDFLKGPQPAGPDYLQTRRYILDTGRQHVLDRAAEIIGNRKWHPRAQRLFAELFTIATVVREVNHEPPLGDDQVFQFVGVAEQFFNCWFCTNF